MHRLAVCIALVLVLSNYVYAQNKPPVTGFYWVEFSDINAFFLCPLDWTPRFMQGKLMPSLVMQQLANNSHPDTQVTVNVVANLTKTNYRLISNQISDYAEAHDKSSRFTVLSRTPLQHDSFSGVSITMSQTRGALENLMIQRIYLANDQRDWLLILNFQSTAAQWTSLTETRNTIMTKFLFKDSKITQ